MEKSDLDRRHRIIAGWLLLIFAMVFAMVVLGGVTRLTQSGLSMVRWEPVSGWLPPLGEAQWEAAFADYRQFPEYRELNVGMTVDEFKSIFWLEFAHRLWGRVIGLAFLVPFLFFLGRRWLDRRLAARLVVVFVLGGLQGVLGWYMVKSGLVDEPDVSQYRLSAHLGAALVIYGYLLWVALGLLLPPPEGPSGVRGRRLARAAAGLCGLVFVTALSGGFVAGLDAGLAYNTFPLMAGELVPEGLLDMEPWIVNFFENVTTVQFDHRLLASAVLVAVGAFWLAARRAGLGPRAGLAVNVLAATAAIQVALGVATLLLVVPVPLAAAHQAGALVLFAAAVWASHELRWADQGVVR